MAGFTMSKFLQQCSLNGCKMLFRCLKIQQESREAYGTADKVLSVLLFVIFK